MRGYLLVNYGGLFDAANFASLHLYLDNGREGALPLHDPEANPNAPLLLMGRNRVGLFLLAFVFRRPGETVHDVESRVLKKVMVDLSGVDQVCDLTAETYVPDTATLRRSGILGGGPGGPGRPGRTVFLKMGISELEDVRLVSGLRVTEVHVEDDGEVRLVAE